MPAAQNEPDKKVFKVNVVRNGAPVASLRFDPKDPLSDLRRKLEHDNDMKPADHFLDDKQYPLKREREDEPVANVIDGKDTVHIGGSEVPEKVAEKKPTAIRVERNGGALVSVGFAGNETLAALRETLQTKGYISNDDRFLDGGKYPVDRAHEDRQVTEVMDADGSIGVTGASTPPKATGLAGKLGRLAQHKPPTEIAKGLLDQMQNDPALKHDLDQKTVQELTEKLAHNLDGVLPHLAAMGPLSDPLTLSSDDWKYLFKRNQMLSGIDVRGAQPRRAFKAACELPAGIPRFLCWDVSEVTASMTYSQRIHSWVRSKIDKTSASASYAFVSASVETSHTERTSAQSETQTAYITGEWNFPRVVVNIEPGDVRPTDAFVAAVAEALGPAPAPTADLKADPAVRRTTLQPIYARLSKVFEEYGQVWPSEVTLGGQLQLADSHSSTANTTETFDEDTIRAAVAVKISEASGSVGHSSSTATDTKDKNVQELQSKNFTATGGNTLLAQQPGDWAATVAPFHQWSTIKMSRLRPLYTMLPTEQQARVVEVLECFERNTVLGLNDGDIVTIDFHYDVDSLSKNLYKDTDAQQLPSVPKSLSHAALPGVGMPVLQFAAVAAGAAPTQFRVEFPLEGQDDVIALRILEPNLPPYVALSTDAATMLRLGGVIALAPLRPAVDPSTLFRVRVLDSKEGLVTLSPYESKALSTGVLIPPFIRAFNLTAINLGFFQFHDNVWLLAAHSTELDAFSVFKITRHDAQA